MELSKLVEIISDVLSIDPSEINEDSKFIDDLGADSLDVFEIIMKIEDEYGVSVSNEDAEKISTVGDALKAITAATGK